MEKLVYPIAKKVVLGVTKVTDTDYKSTTEQFTTGPYNNLYIWTLTTDDYIVAVNRSTNVLMESTNPRDFELFCFICY